MGAVILELHLPRTATKQPNHAIVKIATYVVTSDDALLISKKSLVAIQGKIKFSLSLFQIDRYVEAQLINITSG